MFEKTVTSHNGVLISEVLIHEHEPCESNRNRCSGCNSVFEDVLRIGPTKEAHRDAVLIDDDDFVLTVMETDDQSTVTYPGTFHIGFFVESTTAVDDIHSRLTADGFDVPAPTRRHAYGFYVEAPGGFTVEVGTVEV